MALPISILATVLIANGVKVLVLAVEENTSKGVKADPCNADSVLLPSIFCRPLTSIRFAVLLVIDAPPSLRTEGCFIKKVLVVVAASLRGSV
jgi:hypothetical protein